MSKPKKIKTLDELKELASEGSIEAFIQLSFGLRSSKNLQYEEDIDMWTIYNYIDDTEQHLKTEELNEATNIIEALDKGALYQY